MISDGTEEYYIVDVRSEEEYARGHIPTALNVPEELITTHMPTVYRTTLLIVYGDSGMRSAKAKETLEGMGYLRVIDFGSVSRWTDRLITGSEAEECLCPLRL